MDAANPESQALNQSWSASLIRTNPDLFRLIHDFNYRPSHWIHPARAAALPHAAVSTALLQRGQALPQLNRWIAGRLSMQMRETAFWDFTDPRQRLALLSHETLAKIALFCGAAWRWSRIAVIIGRSQIVELKKAIGEQAHVFALRRGRLVIDQKSAFESMPDRTLVQEIHELGWITVLTALGGECAGLLDRFVLKLPEDVPQFDFFGVNARTRDAAWQRVRKVLGEVLSKGEMKCFA
jgi:hypothetical protein